MKASSSEPLQSDHVSKARLVVRRILHPTDLTTASSEALAVAISLARQNNADLVFVHVLPPPVPIYEIETSLRPSSETALAALAGKATMLGVKAKRVLIKGSAPVGRAIVECANFFRADLIVMGAHGRTGISRWLRGSVAARVIARANCPVLVVPN